MKPFDKKIVLENGLEFYGYGFGADKEVVNEIIFNTSMVGYQEILSDPSYTDQMVVMTYPLIGNYGAADEDYETNFPNIGGMVVREYNDTPSNFRYTKTLDEVFQEHNIPAISGLDTRRLMHVIRDEGAQLSILTDASTPTEEALARLRAYERPHDSVARVSCKKRWFSRTPNHKRDVVIIDCGIKNNFIRQFNLLGCNVTMVPHNATVEEVMAFRPDGVMISNGPGDPADQQAAIQLVRALRGKLPILGVGLGMQIIALAYGAKVEKMKYGHRGSNHPIRNEESGSIEIAVQNHGYMVTPGSCEQMEVTYTNLLDGTIEGVACKADRVLAAQFDPTAIVGECHEMFKKFVKLMEEK